MKIELLVRTRKRRCRSTRRFRKSAAPGVIDLAAASRYTDAQLEASYPVSAAQWDAGDHWYYCFVTRSSKQPLTGSVAAAHPSPSPTPTT